MSKELSLSDIQDFVSAFLQKEERKTILRQGKIDSLASNGRVNITVGKSSIVIPDVARLASYAPSVNDTCWVAQTGDDRLVVGKVADGSSAAITGPFEVTNTAWRNHLRSIRGANTVDWSVTTTGGGAASINVNGSEVARLGGTSPLINGPLHVNGDAPSQSTHVIRKSELDALPQGALARLSRTANQTGIDAETDLFNLSTGSITIPANRLIRVHAFTRFSRDTQMAIATLRLYRGSTQIASSAGMHDSSNTGSEVGLHAIAFQLLSSGSYTFKATLERTGGVTQDITSHASSIAPAFILVEDLGAA